MPLYPLRTLFIRTQTLNCISGEEPVTRVEKVSGTGPTPWRLWTLSSGPRVNIHVRDVDPSDDMERENTYKYLGVGGEMITC